jgi:hypothetical protein
MKMVISIAAKKKSVSAGRAVVAALNNFQSSACIMLAR